MIAAPASPPIKQFQKPVTFDSLQRMKVSIPSCPAVFIRLVQALNNPDSPDLPEIINTDPVLASEVIRAANSAYYGASKRIFSVNDSVMRLGFNEVFSIATALKARETMRGGGKWDAFRAGLWQHAVKTASATRLLARRFNPKVTETIYTVGLLHDLGKLMFVELLPDYGVLSSNFHGEELLAQESQLFGTDHALLGGELLRNWKLPDMMCGLVEKHHEAILPGDHLKLPREELALANEMAHAWSTTFDHALKTLGTHKPQLASRLGFEDVAFFAFLNDWRKESEKLLNL